MFTIDLVNELYPTYILTDTEHDSSLFVVPERGGIITRWRYRGEEILYMDRERFADPSLSVRGGIPILFPICGNLPDNTYYHDDKAYRLPQHGFARDLPWEVIGEDTNNSARLTIELKSSDKTRAVYPFEFRLNFTYALEGNTLKIYQSFKNLSGERMPFSVGFHPYFRVGDKSALSFDIPATRYLDQKSRETVSYDGGFDFARPEIDAAFLNISRHRVGYRDKAASRSIVLSYDNLYSTIVFWTLADKDYICLEPWSAPRNALNTGENLTYIEPGDSREAIITIGVEN